MFELFPELKFSGGYRTEIVKKFSNFRTKMMAVDQKVYMDSLLLRQDKMAMASSVEARVPFCHLPLLKLANKIPNNIRVPGGNTKPLLKKIAESFLPNNLIYRRKVGLNLPLEDWLKNEKGLGRYLDLLVSKDSQLAIYGDKNKIVNTVEKFKKGNLKDLPSLPILINVELWLRSILDPI